MKESFNVATRGKAQDSLLLFFAAVMDRLQLTQASYGSVYHILSQSTSSTLLSQTFIPCAVFPLGGCS